MLEKLVSDTKKYWNYAVYATKSQLKSEVAGSHLNWLWWVLDPLLLMLVYWFIAIALKSSGLDFFPIYIFIGLTLWNFWNGVVTGSIRLLKANKGTVSKVFLPKLTLLYIKMMVVGFKMLISLGIVVLMMLCYRVPITWNVLYTIPLMFVLILVTFGFSTILMHFGVFVEDLGNVINIAMQLLFYMTGIFFSIDSRLGTDYPTAATVLTYVNPMALLIRDMRNVLLYQQAPNWIALGIWTVVAIVFSIIGIHTIYKNENSYVKVI